MKKIGFLFPGQGSQYTGMGQSVAQAFPEAAAIFEAADALRPGTSALCFTGDKEAQMDTKNTQPILYAVEMALVAALRAKGVVPHAAAGYSLGELAALTCAGTLDFNSGFSLVCTRGELMAKASAENPGGMAAVRNIELDALREVCATVGEMYVTNINAPKTAVVAGNPDKMADFQAACKAAGGASILLAVSGGFHSPLMGSAPAEFAPVVGAATLNEPQIPVYANCTAEPYAGDMAELLVRQISEAVQWHSTILNMARDGIDTFVEVGPGKSLTTFVKKILPEATLLKCDTAETVEEVAQALA